MVPSLFKNPISNVFLMIVILISYVQGKQFIQMRMGLSDSANSANSDLMYNSLNSFQSYLTISVT